jgi:hypothetical protein
VLCGPVLFLPLTPILAAAHHYCRFHAPRTLLHPTTKSRVAFQVTEQMESLIDQILERYSALSQGEWELVFTDLCRFFQVRAWVKNSNSSWALLGLVSFPIAMPRVVMTSSWNV